MIQNNNISSALMAYQDALSRVSSKMTPAVEATPAAEEVNFANLVKDGINSAVGAVSQGEQMTLAGIAGKADIQDVVLAVSNAETALNSVVAVRDSAIKAYQQIIQMSI
ncbi:MAG: flagellar hook-basal body complex protein FliE [Alphaproteobacteria bacterium]